MKISISNLVDIITLEIFLFRTKKKHHLFTISFAKDLTLWKNIVKSPDEDLEHLEYTFFALKKTFLNWDNFNGNVYAIVVLWLNIQYYMINRQEKIDARVSKLAEEQK